MENYFCGLAVCVFAKGFFAMLVIPIYMNTTEIFLRTIYRERSCRRVLFSRLHLGLDLGLFSRKFG